MTEVRQNESEEKPGHRRSQGAVSLWTGRFFGVMAAVVLLFSLLGYLGEMAWWLDVLNQGRMQYLWCSLIIAIVLLVARAWRWLFVAIAATAINVWFVAPWLLGAPATPLGDDARHLRLIVLNVRESNEQFEPVLELLRRDRPDLVVLNEVDSAWLKQIRKLKTSFEIFDTPAQEKFGTLLMSRHPIASVLIKTFTDRWSPSIVARLDVDGQTIVLIATHPPAPMDSTTWENRNEHLQELAGYVAELNEPVLVAGDLNVTMWSPHFNDLLEQTTLNEARDSYGINPTFPASRWGLDLPWPLRVPLDHVLASEEWAVLGCKTGPNVGSDHLPLIVDLELRTPTQTADATSHEL